MLSAKYPSIADSLNQERVSPLDGDVITRRFIKEELVEREVELFRTKWFDYRHLTPFQSTCLYIEAYGPIYRQFYRRYFDARAAQHVKPIELSPLLEQLYMDDRTAKMRFAYLWRGRMAADMIGMPYELYLNNAFEYRLRFWNKKFPPQPQHLFDYMDIEKIAEKWNELQETELFVSEHPAYLVQNDQGAAHQKDHRIWLVNQAFKRADPVPYLIDFIQQDVLTPDDVLHQRPEIHDRVVAGLH